MATSYKTKTVKIGNLLLDPLNARIPTDRRSDDQRLLLHELLEHEDVRGLAASIAKLGLFPNERLVAIASGRRFVVLEGNRRLAAVRLLLNPENAATDAQVRYFRRLSGRANLSDLAQVEVAVAADRVAAAPIISALHTREARRRWSSLQQARFYRGLVDEGQTADEVAEELGVPVSTVRNFLRTELLHRLALQLDYSHDVREKIASSKFPLTTLERFLESKVGRKFLGIEIDDKHGFRGVVHQERFKAVLAKVATDVATESGLTRRINDETGFIQYIAEAEKQLPPTKKRGKFLPNQLLGLKEPAPEAPARQKPKPKPKASKSVVPRGFTCTSKHDRVRAIFTELKRMEIVPLRNSTGVMLRVLIDIAIWSFLKDQKLTEAACNHFDRGRKKRKSNPDWTPSVRDLISYCVEKRVFPGMTADGYRSVRTLVAKDTRYLITMDTFNAFTHNPNVTPTESDLRALWQRAEPMLEVILN